MAFRPRPSYRRALIVHQGRGEIDRRRWLFLSLAERKSGGYIFSSEKESLLASPGHKELAAIWYFLSSSASPNVIIVMLYFEIV